VLAAGLGAVLTLFTLVAPGARERPAVIPRLRIEADSLLRAWATALYPSTYGVTLLIVVALFFNGVLAAFLAGIMLGMGGAALVSAFAVAGGGPANRPS
jgi:hypothetical protein